ncbi:MAG: amidohydrolase family protein [Cytophagales bacterium]|nr:amidohydrolase family protein [Cytophagales bacterium]
MKVIKIIIVGIIVAIISMRHVVGQDLLIYNVHVIDVEKGILSENQDILIENGMIVRMAKTKKRRKLKYAGKVIDGTGKYLSPGFIETHVHQTMGPADLSFVNRKPTLRLNPSDSLPEISAKLLLEHGITTARDPGGKTELTVRAKSDIESGKLLGPEFFVAGDILDTLEFINLTVKVTNEDEVRNEILLQKESGVDFIKLYTSLTPDLLGFAINESQNLGLKTIAHLHTTSWTEASELGVDNIVHIVPAHERYLPEMHRDDYRRAAMMGAIGFYKWFEYVDLGSQEISELIQTLKTNHTSIDPTLVVFHATFFGNTPKYTSNAMLDKLPKELVENWKTTFNFNIGWSEQHFTEAQRAWPKVQQFVKKLHDGGVLLTAGTDSNNPWIVPGDSFHDELALLKDCELTHAEVLRIATLNGAEMLGIDHRTGTIEIGKEADLVLLNANPLEDIRHSRDIHIVLSNGMVIE